MARIVERLDFTGADGSRLAARLERPVGPIRAYALFAHCFTCTKDVPAATRIGRGLAERGIAVLRFDFTGLGGSEGEFASTDFSSNVCDLVAGADFLRAQHRAPSLLIGHSLGGAAVLAAAGAIPEVVAVCTIGAPAEPAHVAHLVDGAAARIRAEGEAEVKIGGRPFRIRREFLEDLETHDQASRIRALGRALLVMHGPTDEIVGVDNARRIYEAARHPKSFVSLDGADHLLSSRRDTEYAAGVIAAWAERYLPDDAPAVSLAPGTVIVAENGGSKFANTVRAGRHHLAADEPTSVPGATDTGPSPYDYLLAGLGACTSMTLRMYADRKQWPLEEVSVSLRHSRIYAEDCATCETESGKVDLIERELTVRGDLDDAQRQRLLEIADRCPVHRTLTTENVIRTRLAD